MNDQKLIYFNDLKKYFKRKDPFFTNYDSSFGESSSNGPSLTINHQHHHYGYDWQWGPSGWWWWYPSPSTTVIHNHYGGSGQQKEKEKKKEEGITGAQIAAGFVMIGAVTGIGYLLFTDLFNYFEERNLLKRLKDKVMSIKTTHNQLFINTKPILKQNMAYSRDLLLLKTIGYTSSLVLMADVFYWDDENIMNTCFMTIAGSMVIGVGRYLFHRRTSQSSQSEAYHKQVHSILYGEQSHFQETGPRPPAYNPGTKKEQ